MKAFFKKLLGLFCRGQPVRVDDMGHRPPKPVPGRVQTPGPWPAAPQPVDVQAAVKELSEPTSLRDVRFDIDVKASTETTGPIEAPPIAAEVEYTEMFPPEIKPVNPGWYESCGFSEPPEPYEIFFWWDGALWRTEPNDRVCANQDRYWRGLAHNPHARCAARFALTL